MIIKKILIISSVLFLVFCLFSQERNEPRFDGKVAFLYLEKQCEFGPRNPGSTGHINCKNYLIETMKELADQVIEHPFLFSYGEPPKTATGFNIISRFQPEKKNRLLLCAHWDTRPWADSDPDPAQFNTPILGANDGASGVAVLLHVAELVHKKKPPLGIDIVLFDAEDAGSHNINKSWALGSSAFARDFGSKFSPRFAILLDMIGDENLSIYIESYSLTYAKPVVEKIWNKAQELGISEFIPSVGYAVYDDHIPLLERGILCADIIDFDYPFWHTIEDTPDKCSAKSLEKVGRVITALIYQEK